MTIRDFRIVSHGTSLKCRWHHARDGAPFVVFANAVGMSLDLASHLGRHIADAGVNFVSWENRDSPGPSRFLGDSALQTQADDLSCLINALPSSNIHVVGWCTGASIGLQLAASHPELIDGFIAVSPAFLMHGTPGGPLGDSMFRMCCEISEDPAMAEVYAPIVAPNGNEARALGLEEHGDLLSQFLAPYSGGADVLRRYALAIRHTSDYDPRYLLTCMTCPSLILAGNRDKLIATRNCESASALIGNCRMKIDDELDHYGIFQRSDLRDEVIAFVRECSGADRNRPPPVITATGGASE